MSEISAGTQALIDDLTAQNAELVQALEAIEDMANCDLWQDADYYSTVLGKISVFAEKARKKAR